MAAGEALRELILAGEYFRQVIANNLELDVSQTQALGYLYSRGDLGQSELGSLLGYNTSSVTALVDRLERRGIAERLPHPTDRRRSIVHMTENGRSVITEVGQTFLHCLDRVPTDSVPDLAATLTTVAQDLRAQADRLTAGRARTE